MGKAGTFVQYPDLQKVRPYSTERPRLALPNE